MFFFPLLGLFLSLAGLNPAFAYTSLMDAAIGRYPAGPFDIRSGNGKTEIDYILSQERYEVINWYHNMWYLQQLDPSGFDQIEANLDYLSSPIKNGKGSYQTLLTIAPRFAPGDGIQDRMHDGIVIVHDGHQCPGYMVIDVFDPNQVDTFVQYGARIAQRFGSDPRIAGFMINWGVYGENGYYIGGVCGNDGAYGSRSAGYSVGAITQFKQWMATQFPGIDVSGIDPNNPATWSPILPSMAEPSPQALPMVYPMWMRFRSIKVRQFQEAIVAAMKPFATKPVGTFDYLIWTQGSYARNWTDTPNADVLFNQFYSGTQYFTKSLLETDHIYPAIGPDPPGYNPVSESAAKASIPWNWYRIQMVREMARGANALAFLRPEYQNGPNYLYPQISQFLAHEAKSLRTKVTQEQARVALFVPTWSAASIPRTPDRLFRPVASDNPDDSDTIYYVNLLDSLGVNYDFLREEDLLDISVNSPVLRYTVVLVPAQKYFSSAIGTNVFNTLRLSRMAGFYDRYDRLSQTQMRQLLRDRGVPDSAVHVVSGDTFAGTRALVGMFNGILYNMSDSARTLTVSYNGMTKTLTIPAFTYFTPADFTDVNRVKGSFDGSWQTTPCTVYGWTCDPDNWNQSLKVNLYESGFLLNPAPILANYSFEAPAQCGGMTNHRFLYTFPAGSRVRDGSSHTISAKIIGVNPNGADTAEVDLLLSNEATNVIACPILPTPIPIPGDLNNDRVVNVVDLRAALSQSTLSVFTYNLVVGNYGRVN